MDANIIHNKICSLFNIKTGARSDKEDDELLIKVYSEVFNEVLVFLDKNLDMSRRSLLIKQLELEDSKSATPNYDVINDIIFTYLTAIPEVKYRLYKRIDHFINNMYLDWKKAIIISNGKLA